MENAPKKQAKVGMLVEKSRIEEVLNYLNFQDYGAVETKLKGFNILYLMPRNQEQLKQFKIALSTQKDNSPLKFVKKYGFNGKAFIPEKCNTVLSEQQQFIDSNKYFNAKREEGIDKFNASNQIIPDNLAVKIAVIDSGIDANHRHLENKLDQSIVGKNFIQKIEIPAGYYPLESENVSDQNGHGTHVSGIVIKEIGNVRIYPLKVFGIIGSTDRDIIHEALSWCYDNNVDLVNMSLGFNEYDPIMESLIQKVSKKSIIVASTGNTLFGIFDKLGPLYPAHFDSIISVGSISETENGTLKNSDFSKVWKSVDISASGELIFSTFPNNTYAIMSGTSMAAPYVTGVLASGILLLKECGIEYNQNRIKQLLLESADPIRDEEHLENLKNQFGFDDNEETHRNVFGAGLIDKTKFLHKIKETYNIN